MKILKYNILLFLLLGVFAVNAKDDKKEYVRKVQKVFSCNSNVEVDINNSYGQVHIYAWDKNEVSVEVTISVKANTESAAENMFDRITIAFNGSNEYVLAKTKIAKQNKKWWDEWIGSKSENLEYTINYDVYMPEEGRLSLTNKHGNAYIGSFENDASIDLKYGNLQVDDNEGVLNIVLGHGKAYVRNINSMVGDIKHGELKCNEAENLVLTTSYSTINIETCDRLEVNSKHCTYKIDDVKFFVNSGKYDNFKIEFLDEISMNTQFTDLAIEKLKGACNLTFNYGEVKILEVDHDFEDIIINGQYADFEIAIDEDADFKIAATSNNADIDCFPGIQFMTNKGGVAKELIGYHLNKYSKSRINVALNYGSFDLTRSK